MVTSPNSTDLSGRRILVCRPQPRADETCAALREAGADARAMPMLRIEAREPDGRDRSLLQNIDHYQKVIAVSPSAARLLLAHLEHWWPQWPAGIEWWGPGPGTARVFADAGLDARYPEGGHDTEALLAEPAFQPAVMAGQRVLVARGEGGREALVTGLNRRAARTDILSLYQRETVEWDREAIEHGLLEFNPDTIIALSGETLNKLLELVQNNGVVTGWRMLVAPAERVAAKARGAGFDDVRTPRSLSPPGLVRACASERNLQE